MLINSISTVPFVWLNQQLSHDFADEEAHSFRVMRRIAWINVGPYHVFIMIGPQLVGALALTARKDKREPLFHQDNPAQKSYICRRVDALVVTVLPGEDS